MSRRLVLAIAIAAIAATAPLADANAAKRKVSRTLAKGDIVVIFSGSGGGSYRYHDPASGAGNACRSADTTYTEADSYRWYYRFVLPPGGGSSDTPAAVAGGGQVTATEQLAQCAGSAALTSTCTQALRTPPSSSSDLAYPNIVLDAAGPLVTVGALGELIPTATQPVCSGVGVLTPNPVQGFSQLQAAVSIDRATLQATGDVTRHFTMAGSGLYKGIALSGSCNSGGCDTANCGDSGGAASGPPNSCTYSEGYSGTLEVRLVR
jgi:hypothetical protein